MKAKNTISVQKSWNLVADIGGTNARFAVHDISNDELAEIFVLSVKQQPDFIAALEHVLDQIRQLGQWQSSPSAVCLAVACPVDQDLISFTNSNWQFSKAALGELFGPIALEVINDFSAVAHTIAHLNPDEWHQIGGDQPVADKPIAILGAGTGLGVCTLVPFGKQYIVVDGEGGHIDFAPVNEREMGILRVLKTRFQRVSVERLLSGAGIVNIYQALCTLDQASIVHQSAQEVTEAALNSAEEKALEALSVFCQILGSTASNLALINGAKGGVYIAGGIVPRFLDFVVNSDLRQRFDDKGRFSRYVESIPLRVLLKNQPGLHGAMQKIKAGQI
ncbi:MAG: glucokinase [Gammaproteobacteria bacterium]|nr:glucokinase [Gammaproteobacteria bacterium]MBL7000295.1 glucokinase [Gammaproteobacteria bacterium]